MNFWLFVSFPSIKTVFSLFVNTSFMLRGGGGFVVSIPAGKKLSDEK
jgi:hypothetical protein